MKIKELNKEIIKLFYNKNKKILVEKKDGKIYITDSYVVWILNEEDFIFDINKFKTVNIKSIVDNVENKELLNAIKSNEFSKEKNVVYSKLVCEDIEVTINEKYLKCFNENCTFKVVNAITPVLVYENDNLVGLICPIKKY